MLTLLYSPTSPFVRKVLIVARELGILESIEVKEAVVLPTKTETDVAKSGNPLAKIPTLLIDNSQAIFGSQVICQYLIDFHAKGSSSLLLPPTTSLTRIETLTLESLGDGICEAALLARYEVVLRPEQYRWTDWIDGQTSKIVRSLDELERRLEARPGKGFLDWEELSLGDVAVGCALGYLDFRFGDLAWRSGRPRLEKWFEGFSARSSFVATAPPS
ncbi:hypothetical protein HDU67_001301, partial [Dinochytrium kinnereticum]